MKVVMVTHASAAKRPPKRVSVRGRYELEQAVDMVVGEMGADYRIARAVSSSAVRCIDTAMTFVEELGSPDLKRIETDPRLARLDSPDKLDGVIRDNAVEGLAVFCHADLGGVLPKSAGVREVKDGWFLHRPVVVVLEWSPERGWEDNVVVSAKTTPEDVSLITG